MSKIPEFDPGGRELYAFQYQGVEPSYRLVRDDETLLAAVVQDSRPSGVRMTTTSTSDGSSSMSVRVERAAARPISSVRGTRPMSAHNSTNHSSNRVLLVLIGVLIGLASMGTATAVVVRGGAASRASQGVIVPKASVPVFAALPRMDFSFAEGRMTRRLSVKVLLELDPSAQKGVVDQHAPRIVSAVNTRMSSYAPDDLRGPSGARIVKDTVSAAAVRELDPVRVRGVLVQEMVMN